MAKNIEINILTDDSNKTYEILYPKVDLTNNQGTALPIDSTSGSISITDRTTGNLPSSRLSAGTLSGSFTFTTPPYCSTSPSSSYYLANKAYVDSVANSGRNYLQYKSGSYSGTNSLSYSIYIGLSRLIYFVVGRTSSASNFTDYFSGSYTQSGTTYDKKALFSEIFPFTILFSDTTYENLDLAVSSNTASSASTSKCVNISTSYTSNTLKITYGAIWGETLTYLSPNFNRSGRTYYWFAYGY